MARYASLYFPYLLTDYVSRKQSEYRGQAFVMAVSERGRMIVKAVSPPANKKGIFPGMVVADCKAIFPDLIVLKTDPQRTKKLLTALAEWCIGYTPFVALDLPDGLILDTSGCTHLWGGEQRYLENISARLNAYGYDVRTAIADTIGTAWAMARFGCEPVVKSGRERQALSGLPPSALRLEENVLGRLKKLGLLTISSFFDMPDSALRRRFGPALPHRIRQALGSEVEMIQPVRPVEPYQQRLPSLEPVCSADGIAIALQELLQQLCKRFESEGVGLRSGIFKAYRIDGDVQKIEIGTKLASCNVSHLFRLFEHKIGTFEPELGFELFVLEASKVDQVSNEQGAMWNASAENDVKVAELLDRLAAKMRPDCIRRYLPAEHYWPERSVQEAISLGDKPVTSWRTDIARPVHLLMKPEIIEVAFVLPDYPPIFFLHKGEKHEVVNADGPERIEQEWWIEEGKFRDYYSVEDAHGSRFWLFRLGPYDENPKWFLHGFFA
ncbi:Y-family DNA polymerase [Flavobacterium selenitireducens]|uniref:Y-family DNA polymerase n=1 Tax=Flavobacterium selenitireducens TaxID=2722704 RepID=UPI00168BE6AA|nr:DNA polymerase Y family protein [Flavobacterium selenitireducens]MBD3582257.1 DNA polymerase Y family protein [Flavobacterium selenitireducens]